MNKHLALLLLGFFATFGLNAKTQTVSFANLDHQVPAVLTTPDNLSATERVPAIVMLHGTGSQKNEVGDLYKKLAERLAQKGIASLRLDFVGYGDSSGSDLSYSLSSAVSDGSAAIRYLASSAHIDANRIALIGFSQGALIAQLLAIDTPSIDALVAWSPAVGDGVEPMQDFYHSYHQEAAKNGYALIKYDWRTPFRVSKTWFDELVLQRSLTQFSQFKGSLLAVSGSNDKVVPWQNANRLIAAAGSHNATAVVIKGADHIFNVFDANAHHSNELLRITSDWLQTQL